MKKLVDSVEVEMTPEEEAEWLAMDVPVAELPLEPQQPEEIVVPERDYGAEIDALEARVTALEEKS